MRHKTQDIYEAQDLWVIAKLYQFMTICTIGTYVCKSNYIRFVYWASCLAKVGMQLFGDTICAMQQVTTHAHGPWFTNTPHILQSLAHASHRTEASSPPLLV